MAAEQIPLDHPRYQEWLDASNRLRQAADRLDAMSHLPESAPEFLAAHREWLSAKASCQAISSGLRPFS